VLQERAPEGAELVRVDEDTDLETLQTLDFLILNASPSPLFSHLPDLTRLQVLQTLSAGTDTIAGHVPPHVTLCSARGARDSAVAEWCFGALLAGSTRIARHVPIRKWERDGGIADLSEWRVLIVGMGSIGRELARIMQPLGTDVVGVASRARDDLHGVDELPQLLPTADAVVLLAPLTDATRGMIGAEAMRAMRDGTLIVNAARGAVIDTDALVAETAAGRLQAILDVTEPEPLPDGHPLWSAQGVLAITPHIAGDSPRAARQAATLAAEQLERFLAGRPLVNVVREGKADPS
jgi:phosphoglycerate dehydrogenase-like enzyme